MEPHSCSHVRTTSYLLLDGDVIFLFQTFFSEPRSLLLLLLEITSRLPIVSRTFGRREMSCVVDFAKGFEEATTYTSVNLSYK